MKNLLCAIGAVVVVLALSANPARATVVIAGTRVVFPAATGEVTVRLSNEGSQPALVEAWIDDGDPSSTPDTAKVPFLVTPPLARMNAGKGQSLRIVFAGQPLPTDHESLFWLNVLEIPPKPTARTGEEQNTLQFAVRSRLKLFFRPAQLGGDSATAAQDIIWSMARDGDGYALEAHNKSPYYITFSKVAAVAGQISHDAGIGMVAPQSTLRLKLSQLDRSLPPGNEIDYTVINDFGAATPYKGAVTP
jgi:chaperone protein EcpD